MQGLVLPDLVYGQVPRERDGVVGTPHLQADLRRLLVTFFFFFEGGGEVGFLELC